MLEKNEQRPVEELMNPNVVSVVTSTDREDAAQLIEKYGYLALPVVDKENRLVGILTLMMLSVFCRMRPAKTSRR